MTPNELLLWLSARKEGSWPQFRGAVENLDLLHAPANGASEGLPQVHQRVRQNLERLAHVEFDAAECTNGWRVVPPVLALTEAGGEAVGILCGARTPRLLERIERSVGRAVFERVPYDDCPDIIRVRAQRAETLSEMAGREGVLCQADTPAALLSRLPRVNSLGSWKREALPASGKEWNVEQFVIEKKTMKWNPVTVKDANAPGVEGLFRFTRFQTPQYFFREGRETVKLPGAIGKYLMLWRRRKRVLKYDRKERTLAMRAIVQPPLLTERALILCSGFLPSLNMARGFRYLTYRDIPEDIAGLAAEVLKQDLI
jgi:hypothetical protein